MRGKGVVAIIFERVLDRFRNDDRPREMHDRRNPLVAENTVDQRAIGNIALVERDAVRHRLARSVGKIVDDGDPPACIEQGKDGMAADIAGAAGNKDWDFAHAAALAKLRQHYQPERTSGGGARAPAPNLSDSLPIHAEPCVDPATIES